MNDASAPAGSAAVLEAASETDETRELLLPEHIAPHLRTPIDMRWKRKTGTTNDDAKDAAREGLEAAVCIAEEQGTGKGRMGRSWVSGGGDAVELSILLRPELPASDVPSLALAAALAVCDAVQQVTGEHVSVKWPNDVLLNGRKICGILCEAAVEGDRLAYVVTGIGVNVNQNEFPEPIRQTATSLAIESHKKTDRAEFAAALIDNVRVRVDAVASGGIESIMDEYRKASSVLDRVVDVSTANGNVTGKCVGFGPHGELEVLVDGTVRSFLANDVSVREARNV